jgi:hypothetical protein
MNDQLTKWLSAFDNRVDAYGKLKWNEGEKISEYLKDLTVILCHLEHHRKEAHEKWNSLVFEFDGSVSRAEINANEQVPELYQLRRIMNAGYRVVDAMRSNISFIKKES